jgi:phosphoribosylformylglycinamidine synthase
VLECASNLACVGAEPLGTTNNLNFGNPEKSHIAWQLTESVRGLGDACRALGAPIVGGNVSLYNEGATGPIYPTPVIGMVGRLPDARRAGRLGFAAAGDQIALVGPFAPSLAASELAKLCGQPLPEGLEEFDIDAVLAAQVAVRDAVRAGLLASAHDIAEGGLAVALAECCLAGAVGASVRLGGDFWQAIGPAAPATGSSSPASALSAGLFGEGPGGFLVSGERDALRRLGEGVPLRPIGSVGGEALTIAIGDGGPSAGSRPAEDASAAISVALSELAGAHARLRELFA